MSRDAQHLRIDGQTVQPLTPRAWAAAIVQLPTLAERRAAMELARHLRRHMAPRTAPVRPPNTRM